MTAITAFFTLSTFGFVLKLLAGIAAAAFGILGIGAKTRDDAGHLRREGKIALVGILVATLIGGVSTVYDFVTAQKTAEVERRRSERLMLSVQRGIYPLHGMKLGFYILMKENFGGLAEYKRELLWQCAKNAAPLRCESSGGPNPTTYYIPISSRLFPAKDSAVFRAINKMCLRFTLFKAGPASEGSAAYVPVGKTFEVDWQDRLPANTQLIYDVHRDEMRLVVHGLELEDFADSTGGVYSLADFSPGMIAVYSYLREDACDGLTYEACDQLRIPLLRGSRVYVVNMSFPYPIFVGIDDTNEIECEYLKRHYIARILPDDIDSLVLGEAGKGPSKADKDLVCKAILAPFPGK
jgi:hypothetical protein